MYRRLSGGCDVPSSLQKNRGTGCGVRWWCRGPPREQQLRQRVGVGNAGWAIHRTDRRAGWGGGGGCSRAGRKRPWSGSGTRDGGRPSTAGAAAAADASTAARGANPFLHYHSRVHVVSSLTTVQLFAGSRGETPTSPGLWCVSQLRVSECFSETLIATEQATPILSVRLANFVAYKLSLNNSWPPSEQDRAAATMLAFLTWW